MEPVKGVDRQFCTVTTLLNRSLLKVVEHLPSLTSALTVLPPNLKEKMLGLMSKRGLITDTNFHMVVHSKVQELDLVDSDVSDVTLQEVARGCPLLRKLDLNTAKGTRTRVSAQAVSHVAEQCRHLQVVYLRRCVNVTDDTVVAVSRSCPMLRYLNLAGCPLITDRALAALGENSPHLRCLDLTGGNVTDEGIISLVSGPCATSLKEINVQRCTNLSDDAIEAIIQFCPNIAILVFQGCPNMTERSRLALEELMVSQTKMKQVMWTVY